MKWNLLSAHALLFSLLALTGPALGEELPALPKLELDAEVSAEKEAAIIERVMDSVARVSPEDGELAGKKSSIGTGMLIDKRGYVLTNLHVIGNATKVRIKFPGKRARVSSEILKDKRTDIAILKLDETAVQGIAPIEIQSSEEIRLGTAVFAIGVPYGFDGTVSRGIISGKDRYLEVNPYVNYLQTDAALNPGNSGGPLVCCQDGRCIGVVNAIHSNSGSNIGIGFVISGEQAKFVADQLIQNGKVTRGYIGTAFREVTDEQFEAMDIEFGVMISRVLDNSPASTAGLKKGDVVMKIKDRPVSSVNMLIHRIASSPIGEKIELTVFRDSEEIKVPVEIQKHPSE